MKEQINIYIVIIILLMHWIGDFLLQTDWQAKNKSKNSLALMEHVFTYMSIWFVPILFVYFTGAESYVGWGGNMGFFPVITLVIHAIQDYFTSRLNTKLWNEGKVHWFFVSIGFDQLLHFIQLLLTYQLLS